MWSQCLINQINQHNAYWFCLTQLEEQEESHHSRAHSTDDVSLEKQNTSQCEMRLLSLQVNRITAKSFSVCAAQYGSYAIATPGGRYWITFISVADKCPFRTLFNSAPEQAVWSIKSDMIRIADITSTSQSLKRRRLRGGNLKQDNGTRQSIF